MADLSEMQMFENGLARGREIGAEQERSRIIKLLKSLIQEPNTDLTYIVGRNDALYLAINLIQVNNK